MAASCIGIGDSLPSTNNGSVGESADTSAVLGRKGGGMSANIGCTTLTRSLSESFFASSSVGGGLDRELAVRSVKSTEPYDDAESIEARFASDGLSAIEFELTGTGVLSFD